MSQTTLVAVSRARRAGLARLALVVVLVGASVACSTYRGTARDTTPTALAREPGWLLVLDVPLVQQEQ